jgi:hypothetical protein
VGKGRSPHSQEKKKPLIKAVLFRVYPPTEAVKSRTFLTKMKRLIEKRD